MICPSCQKAEPKPFLPYGRLPLGNAFLRPEEVDSEEVFPLELAFCENCQLVQQAYQAPLSNLRRVYENYPYVPVGNTLTNHLTELGNALVGELGLSKDSFVVDIGSNDGTLLSAISPHCRVLGVEPARHLAEVAIRRGVNTIAEFFDRKVLERIVADHGYADLVITTQTMQHIPKVRSFVEDILRLLKPNGVYVTEGRYLGDMMRKASFDSIYHEMLYIFHLGSLNHLFRQAGLKVFRAQRVDIYGGSLRVYACKEGYFSSLSLDASIPHISDDEDRLGLHRYETYLLFAKRVLKVRDELRSQITMLKAQGKKIAAYGAPSTGTTLLNFCGIGAEHVDYIVDDNPLKQGLLQPGTHIPVVDSSALAKDPPDYLLILAWRLRNEILQKVGSYRDRGMKSIVPLPEVEIIG